MCRKRLLKISPRCHGNLLHWLVNDLPVDLYLCKRFFKFMKGICKSSNSYVNLCGQLIIAGSGFAASNNVTVLSEFLHIPKSKLPECKLAFGMNCTSVYEEKLAGNIRDILDLPIMD